MINIPIEPYGFRLHFTTSKRAMKKAYATENNGAVLDVDDCSGQMWHNGNDFYIGVYDDGPKCIDTLAHECQHCLLDIAVYIGYNPGVQQEPLAYLAGWMFKTLLFAHPKFKEAMNEPVGTRSGNGGRRAPKGDVPHTEQ